MSEPLYKIQYNFHLFFHSASIDWVLVYMVLSSLMKWIVEGETDNKKINKQNTNKLQGIVNSMKKIKLGKGMENGCVFRVPPPPHPPPPLHLAQ